MLRSMHPRPARRTAPPRRRRSGHGCAGRCRWRLAWPVYLGLARRGRPCGRRAARRCGVGSRRVARPWPTALRAAAGGGGRRVGSGHPGSAPGSGSRASRPLRPSGVSARTATGLWALRSGHWDRTLSRPRGHTRLAGHGAGHGPTVKLDHRTAAVAVAAPRDFKFIQ